MKNYINLLRCVSFLLTGVSSIAQPTIITQPADQTANQGFSATFNVTATATAPPLSYQWFFASNAIAGAITNTLTFTNTQPTNAGSYFVVVTDTGGSITSRTAALTVVLPAVLNPKLSANIRLGEDSPLLTNRPAQGEVHLARSFTDPNLLIAAFQDSMATTHEPQACSYAVSTNGGFTWTRALIPGLTTVSGGTNGIAGDNVAAVDRQGHLYIASLVGPLPLSWISGLWISKSVDAGHTFAVPHVVRTGTPSDFPDKEWLAINTFPGSSTANRMALAFNKVDSADNESSHSIYSDDGGVTWSPPLLLGSLTAGVQNFFLPDGSLVVLYWRFVGDFFSTDAQRVEMVRSVDGGTTFGAPALVMDASGFDNSDLIIAGPRFNPSACADRQAGVIYVAVGALTGSGTNRAARVLFTKSIDQGKTWSASVQVNDTPSPKSVLLPSLAVSPDGQHVTIEFYDKRNDSGQGYFVDLYLAESFDGGDTWEPNIRLSDVSSDVRRAPLRFNGKYWLGDYQAMVPSLNFDTPAVACWIDTRSGNNDPYVVRIKRTQGTTFNTWRKLRFSTNDLTNPAVSGEKADPDGDGISNLAEYAFGMEPNHADSSPYVVSHKPGTSEIVISFERLAVLGDVFAAWYESADLKSWQRVSPASTTVTQSTDPIRQKVSAAFPVNDSAKFYRLAWLFD